MVVSSATITELYVPKNAGDGIVLTLESEITKQTYSFDIEDLQDMEGYYHILVDFSEIEEGEYRYSLGTDTGVIRIGSYKTSNTQYKKEEKHIQYQYGGI